MSAPKQILMLFVFLLLSACASWSPSYEKPQVSITSFTLAPESTGIAPTFLIGLRVVNPNRNTLPLKGMSYAVEIEQQRVLTGAEPDLPQVPGYGTADFTIKASPDLLGSARLINQLLSGQRGSLDYLFKARFDIGRLLPFVTVEEKGSFGLTDFQ
ncbi:LEA type 2 family protein [Methylophaga sp.]|uniref:LEA type 2 family protein n=1 Tax=Methylophaga sp. TaxID=2024840 RepID=UPI003F696A7F